jgi:hypothetical protein
VKERDLSIGLRLLLGGLGATAVGTALGVGTTGLRRAERGTSLAIALTVAVFCGDEFAKPCRQVVPSRSDSLMWFRGSADVVLVVHFVFVLFVMFGGLLALRWPRVAWVHVPVALYGATIEFLGFICPLTPLEVWLRRRGGETGYSGGFIEHYITAALYPAGLTREIQVALGVGVLLLNAIVYGIWWRRRRR